MCGGDGSEKIAQQVDARMTRKVNRKRPGKKKTTPVTVETLRDLRSQLGTKELARRMGIPIPSLRRLVGSGKSAGLPKRKTKAFHRLVQRVGAARMSPRRGKRMEAARRASAAARRGELDSSYNDIADELGMEPREVYWLGVSPGQFGQVA